MATGTAQELAAPLGSVHTRRLVFTRGASHLTIGVNGSMDDLYRARFEGRVPVVRTDGSTVTVRYRVSQLSRRLGSRGPASAADAARSARGAADPAFERTSGGSGYTARVAAATT